MVVVAVVLRDDALSVLAWVLVDKSIEGYPLADRALHKSVRLHILHRVRVRDRIVPSRFLSHKQVTVRTRGEERVTGRIVQVEADGVSEDHI